MKNRLNHWMWLGCLLLLLAASNPAQAFYNPTTGRWLSRDPIAEEGGANLYGFVHNRPLMYVDARGLLEYYYSSGTIFQPAGPVPYLEGETWYGNVGTSAYNIIPISANLIVGPLSQIGTTPGTVSGQGGGALQMTAAVAYDGFAVAPWVAVEKNIVTQSASSLSSWLNNLWGRLFKTQCAAKTESALVRVGDQLTTVNDVLRNPNLLSGKGPAEIQAILGKTPGWQIETLGQGSRAGQGWVLREYTAAGNPTGRMMRWHPGGGHHGPNPYWRVTGGPDGKSGIILGGTEP